MPFKSNWRVIPPFAILLILSIFALSGADPAAAQGTIPPPGPTFIGAFNQSRAGAASFNSGSYYDEARATLTTAFTEVRTTEFYSLSAESLEGLSALFLDASFSNNRAIEPLTTDEQAALGSFVAAGGCAILIVDNDTYDTLGKAPAANNSLVNAFGMTAGGTLSRKVIATVGDTSISPVTSAMFRVVAEFSQNYPGAITDAGTDGTVMAVNPLGAALVVVSPGALADGSGPVIVASDGNTFSDSDEQGFFPDNVDLFLNTIAYCLDPDLPATYRLFAPNVSK